MSDKKIDCPACNNGKKGKTKTVAGSKVFVCGNCGYYNKPQ